MIMQKILVTGGHGFIASHVIDYLKKQGRYQVFTNVRNKETKREWLKGVEIYPIDMRDKAGIFSLVSKVDGVIHLAGLLGTGHVENSEEFFEVNLQGARNVVSACREFAVDMVGIGVGNYWMLNNYSNSKYAAEREILTHAHHLNVKANIVRGLNVFGARQKVLNTNKVIPTFICNALQGREIKVYGGKEDCGLMDMVYVGDVAKILVEVLTKPSESWYKLKGVESHLNIGAGGVTTTTKNIKPFGNIYEAGTGQALKVWQLAEDIIRLCESKSEIIAVPMRPGETVGTPVVASKPFELEGGYADYEKALLETINYYRWAIATNLLQ